MNNNNKEQQLINENFFKRQQLPITEMSNELTHNIDLVESGDAILTLLHKTDNEIINGWQIDENLKTYGLRNDLELHGKLNRIANLIASELKKVIETQEPQFSFLLSGCGTSGRLAYLCSQTMNEHFRKKTGYQRSVPICDYIIAGDNYALVNSIESVEDKPGIGAMKLIEKLKTIGNTEKKIIFIGISCGLSAPFVAGQLDYCLNHANDNIIGCGIIGFNPVEMARSNVRINESGQTFLDLMLRLRDLERRNQEKYFILNPIIGPEPITGSSRMKSGSATKIMLDLIVSKAFQILFTNNSDQSRNYLTNYTAIFDLYQRILDNVVYADEKATSFRRKLAHLIDLGANSLRNINYHGSINYLSDSVRLGFLCCVDASECVPTYGASKTDIRGFVSSSNTGAYLSNQTNDHKASWFGFMNECESVWSTTNELDECLSENSFILMIGDDEIDKNSYSEEIKTIEKVEKHLLHELKSKAKIIHLDLNSQETLRQIIADSREIMNGDDYLGKCLEELTLKLILNAISTGSNVLIGKTYENVMIDVKVSNVKLFWRAVDIIKKLANLKDQPDREEISESYLLRSIYRIDDLKKMSNERSNIDAHVESATNQEYVVPKALIMALTNCTYQEAEQTLSNSRHSIRNCISKLKS